MSEPSSESVPGNESEPFDRPCAECGHPEYKHVYSPPMHYSSSDGLPDFEGCWGLGQTGSDDYPIPICECSDFLLEDDLPPVGS